MTEASNGKTAPLFHRVLQVVSIAVVSLLLLFLVLALSGFLPGLIRRM